MKPNLGRYALIGALVAAFLAAMGHLEYIRSLDERKTVVVVTREVAPYELLDDSNLTLAEMPANAVQGDVVTNLADARGKYTKGHMVPGQMVHTGHFMTASGSLAARVTADGNPRMRAMAIKVLPETSVANTVKPGDKVDLLVSLKIENTQGRNTITKIIAEAVPVLYTSFEKDSQTMTREGTVVLEVSAQLAEEIAFAQANGTLTLLTNPFDAQREDSGGVSLDGFLQKHGVAKKG